MGWKQVIIHGNPVDVCQQDGAMSCGMACVAMVVNWKTGSKPTERVIMQLSGTVNERKYFAANVDRPRSKNPSSANK
jgi:predicted double-glycine peptidase